MFAQIMKYKVFSGTKIELLDYVDTLEKVNIISGNPEVLYSGMHNEFLYKCFTEGEALIIPDGVGTVLASKILKKPVKEKIAGIEVMEDIIYKCSNEGKKIYLLGAEEEVLQGCINNLKKRYKGLKIVGSHNGYFSLDKCEDIVEDIVNKSPYAIFVATGCPRQETFILEHMHKFNCKVIMGVGGSFDVIGQKVKRAPKWMIRLGLEWLYRTIKDPCRIKRLMVIPKFLLQVIKYKWSKNSWDGVKNK